MQEREKAGFKEDKQVHGSKDWSGSGRGAEPEAIALSRILKGFGFPASKEDIVNRLAMEAFTHEGGRAADLHDLVVQLEPQDFRDLEELRKAIRERHAWERTQDAVI